MSTSASAAATLSSGAQLLLNDGFLPSNLSTATLAKATPAELDAMASASISQANVDTLFGIASGSDPLFPSVSSESGDSVLLSDEATALLGQTTNASTTSASSVLSNETAELLGLTTAGSTSSTSTDPILSLL